MTLQASKVQNQVLVCPGSPELVGELLPGVSDGSHGELLQRKAVVLHQRAGVQPQPGLLPRHGEVPRGTLQVQAGQRWEAVKDKPLS